MFSSPQIRENPQAGQTTGHKHPEIPSWPYMRWHTRDNDHCAQVQHGVAAESRDMQTDTHTHICVVVYTQKPRE